MSSCPSVATEPDHDLVVLVDDDDGFRSALAETLRDEGHKVAEYGAPSQVPSLDGLQDAKLMITDYDMPGTNGLAFADAFHARYPAVPIVLISSFPTPMLVTQAAARGFVRLLPKPVDYEVLRQVLLESLAKH
jgi:DNA-binding NtrC family response regulator